MRAIKFRGKRMNDNKWVYGYFGKDYSERCIISNYLNAPNESWGVIPETIGQFTGVLDRNKKEVYEGDIVTWVCSDGETRKDVVRWINGGLCLCNSQYTVGSYYGLEVVGNIHDNPELIN